MIELVILPTNCYTFPWRYRAVNFEVYQDETLQLINLFILKTCQQDNIFESLGQIICSSPMGV